MELSTFNVGDRHFRVHDQYCLSNTVCIVDEQSGIPVAQVEPCWGTEVPCMIQSYDITLINQLHPFFEGEDLFLGNVVEQKAAILKAIFTIQSLVAAGLL